jgi:predicted nucleic acid-binding protein
MTSLPSADEIPDFVVSTDSSAAGYLESAIEIWKKYRATLGLFPKGAFQDHARKGWILYLLEGSVVAGYLLYRMAKGRAVIVHLCIDETYRRRGGAKVLFQCFREKIDDGQCRGIEVKCRADYEVAPIWPSLGFQFVKAGLGRGNKATELVKWYFHFDVNDFFYDLLPKQEEDEQVWAVLDANIIFKLDEPDCEDSQEACALLAETVGSYTQYWVTPEIFSEIERKQNKEKRDSSRKAANRFPRIEARRSDIDYYKALLLPLWKGLTSARDVSDMMHIVYTASAGIRIFITQDCELLEKAEQIQEYVDVRVMRPAAFIAELDELENESRYNPASIARSIYSVRCPKVEEIPRIAELFTNIRDGEKQKQFEAKLRSYIAAIDSHDVSVIVNALDDYILLVASEKGDDGIKIKLLRNDGSPMADALVQNWLWKSVCQKEAGRWMTLRISDSKIPGRIRELFSQRGFISSGDGVVRFALRDLIEVSELPQRIGELSLKHPEYLKAVGGRIERNTGGALHHFEEAFWPLKFSDADIPTFLVPIQPTWAKDLFDEGLAMQNLFGADPDRYFNWENVYYRSSRAVRFQSGSRLLWYVSTEKEHKVSEIRACSRLIGHEVDAAKTLFKKYRKLGIYQWRNLMDLTKGDPYGKLMALRFYQTECFINPIPLKEFAKFGINGAPMGPARLSKEQFSSIYRIGMNLYE